MIITTPEDQYDNHDLDVIIFRTNNELIQKSCLTLYSIVQAMTYSDVKSSNRQYEDWKIASTTRGANVD